MKIVAFQNDLDDVRLEASADKELDGVRISIIDSSKTRKVKTSLMLEYQDLLDFINAMNEFKVRLDEDLEEEEYEEDEEDGEQ